MTSGSTIDLVIYLLSRASDTMEAAKLLGDWYGIPMPKPNQAQPEKKSREDYIAQRCLEQPEPVVDYLMGRGISEDVIRRAIQTKSIGWNTGQAQQFHPVNPDTVAPPRPSSCACSTRAVWWPWICAMPTPSSTAR
ncbi:hypothetical protein [Paludibacterium denitrificans]|uniref:hypothetical protein n=1 Tax=Paludibacterium denitrificans TaxID=2675226 RepID=UPI001E4729FF|nr:hypothetical protein [Paludibacterium denitrificans]